jgi:hypothetical protein
MNIRKRWAEERDEERKEGMGEEWKIDWERRKE